MQINNNTILITGGTSGIGASLTKTFVTLGNKVIICARNQSKLDEMQAKYRSIDIIRCDLSNKQEILEMCSYLEQNHPNLNILVNNAGIQYNYDFSESSSILDKINHEIDVNLKAPLYLTSLLMPMIVRQEKSAIINLTSLLAIVPKQSAPVYCGTKSGLHTFSQSLRYQLEGTPTKIIEIIPPLVETNMTKGRGSGKMDPDVVAEKIIQGIEKDKNVVTIGKAKVLLTLNRILPSLARKIMRKK